MTSKCLVQTNNLLVLECFRTLVLMNVNEIIKPGEKQKGHEEKNSLQELLPTNKTQKHVTLSHHGISKCFFFSFEYVVEDLISKLWNAIL